MQMFPRAGIQQSDIDEFNQQMQLRDRAHPRLHRAALSRHQSPGHAVLARLRDMSIPASLQHRIDLFRETGRVFRVPNELFAENSWIQVMLGQGIMPRQHHPVADLMGDEELSRIPRTASSATVERTVAQLPQHQAYRRAVLQSAGRAPRGRRVKRASANIYEVAELAGVSLATVSRVINPGAQGQREDAAESAGGDAASSATSRIPSRSRWRRAARTASACWSRSCTARSSARC